jgi:hypothetical protein
MRGYSPEESLAFDLNFSGRAPEESRRGGHLGRWPTMVDLARGLYALDSTIIDL